ncbi:MAG: right-handed parallel beta-helix repeat-containing protein [Planctomycetes bacterium]|nr:right-handed parallel beta-helix repeat-containing protein [Planctomycetota bacterium]
MKRLFCFAVCCLSVAYASAADFHVSPDGSDENPATVTAPVKSLEKARDLARAVRKAEPDEPIRILLHPGIYMVRKTVEFAKEDSGTESALLTIKAWNDPKSPNDWPKLVGGVVVSGWKKSDFDQKAPSSTAGQVFEADLKPLGINDKFRQIYLNGTRQIWARYPDYDPALPYSGGWAYVDGERPPMYTDIEGEPTDTVVMRAKDQRDWSRPTDGEVCIFPRYNWWNRIEKIQQFDSATRTITLAREMPYAARPEDRYAVLGMKEELDAPGEWYQDVEGQKLYFLPPRSLDGMVVAVPTVDTILSFEHASNVIVRGLEFTCAEAQAVRLSDCEQIAIEKSLIHDLGYFSGAGISIRGGRNCTVRGCDLWNLGGHGVEVYAGDKVTMEKCNHVVDNCYIHHVGQFNRHGIGLMLSGCGVILSHNLIHDVPRCGVFYGGVLNTLEYNRIRHCNLEMEDTGCTYGGGWTGGWTTIRYNHCTDSIGFNNHGKFFVFAWGIYLDESGCGFDVYGNLVERCQVGAMHLHNARENHITNNIFAENACSAPDPERFGTTHQISLQGWTDDPNGKFLADREPKMLKRYNQLVENPEWKKMRGMAVPPKETILPDGTVMRGNRIERNVFYYRKQPKSRYVRVSNCNLEANVFDYNTIWNGGKEPIRTGKKGYKVVGASRTESIPNREFPAASEEQLKKDANQTAAQGWFWYHKQYPDVKSEVVTNDEGKRVLRFAAANNPEMKYIKYACVRSEPFAFEPGKDYRLAFTLRTKNASGSTTARLVSEANGLWRALGSQSFKTRDGERTECQIAFHYPAEGEEGYNPRLGKLNIQFGFHSKAGTAEISDLLLEEVVPMSEWEAWQQAGGDVHSIVADPMFVDAEHGDFRLKPDSPALKQGFEPIPLDKIGLYEDDARVTWPIQEAEGVREHPEWLQSVPINN